MSFATKSRLYKLLVELSRVWLFVTSWTVAHQAPLSMGFFPGKNTGVDCHFLLQGTFPTQESSPCLLHILHWQADSLPMSHLVSPRLLLKKTRHLKLRDFIFFCVWKDAGIWAHWNHSFDMHLCYWSLPCAFSSRVSSGLTIGSGSLIAAESVIRSAETNSLQQHGQ